MWAYVLGFSFISLIQKNSRIYHHKIVKRKKNYSHVKNIGYQFNIYSNWGEMLHICYDNNHRKHCPTSPFQLWGVCSPFQVTLRQLHQNKIVSLTQPRTFHSFSTSPWWTHLCIFGHCNVRGSNSVWTMRVFFLFYRRSHIFLKYSLMHIEWVLMLLQIMTLPALTFGVRDSSLRMLDLVYARHSL